MGIYRKREESSPATYTITVGVAIAVAVLLLTLPGLELIWRVASVLALVVLQALNLAVLAGIPRRVSGWRTRRRQLRTLNRTSGLVADLARLAGETHRVIYDEKVNNLPALVGEIGGKGRPEWTNQFSREVRKLDSHYKVLRFIAEEQTRWERNPFLEFVRGIAEHFRFLDPVLDAFYEVAKEAPMSDNTLKNWESFKENYNQLRADWKAYFKRVPAAIGQHVELRGEPARSLPQPA